MLPLSTQQDHLCKRFWCNRVPGRGGRTNRATISNKKSPGESRGISIYEVESLPVLLTLLTAVLTTLLAAAALLATLTSGRLILLTGFLLTALLTALLLAALLFATHLVSP